MTHGLLMVVRAWKEHRPVQSRDRPKGKMETSHIRDVRCIQPRQTRNRIEYAIDDLSSRQRDNTDEGKIEKADSDTVRPASLLVLLKKCPDMTTKHRFVGRAPIPVADKGVKMFNSQPHTFCVGGAQTRFNHLPRQSIYR